MANPGSPSAETLIALADEIAALTRAGIPLESALAGMAEDDRGELQHIAHQLAVRLNQGQSLQKAVEASGLPRVFQTVVMAGVYSGQLPEALTCFTESARWYRIIQQQILLMLIYPAVVVSLAYVLFLASLAHYGGELVGMYDRVYAPRPAWAHLIAQMNESMAAWAWVPPVLLAVMLLWGVLCVRGLSRQEPRSLATLSWVPWLSGVIRNTEFARFCDILGLLLRQQLPLAEALLATGETTGNRRMEEACFELAEESRRGASLSDSLRKSSAIPPFLRWTLSNAASQPELPAGLQHLRDIYRRRALLQAGWFRTLMPMFMTLGIGGLVALVYALSVFLPFRLLLQDLDVI